MEYHKLEEWEERAELKRLVGVKPRIEALYYRGKWNPEIFEKTVAIVGSRRMTEYGKRVLEKMIPPLLLQKKTIISGFMYGVDQYAHRLCVEGGGRTVAVLGWGISERLQIEDNSLQKKIIESGGLMLSEWENQKPLLWTFPHRNRIVAALADEVIVIEAAEKSGSLITANLATKLKRPLYAVPGSIFSRVSRGTNQLIASGQAMAWIGDDRSKIVDNKSNDPLVKILSDEGMTADELARKMKRPVAELGAQLSLLTLKGEVVERGGKYYSSQS